jgi:DNA polymerase-3 subunit gamma/tau
VALALYRKYRPATFADVMGQEHVTEPLRTALAAGRISHAYLFSGPRGCGKTSSARILARSLNCAQGPTPDPCGECASCIALAPEGPGSIDVVELDAASHGGVDDARDLRDRAFYTPADSRYRVFIIDEAHMVTTQGFNALLKIVEEPPEHLVFVFATTEPDKVLATIRSRTHHYPFRLMPPSTMRRLLERICADEGVDVEPSVFPLVVRAGGGSARDSLSVLDQLLAGAGPQGVRYERAVALLGVSDAALIDDVVDGLAAGDGAAVFNAVERLVDAGHDPRRFATDLLERFRDLTLLQAVPDAAVRGLVDAPQDALERMTAQADRIPPAALARYGEIVHSGLIEMRGATAPRLLLELLCARMLLPAASAGEAALLHRLELLERRLTLMPTASAQPAAPAPSRSPQSGTAAPAAARSEAGDARAESAETVGTPETAGAAAAGPGTEVAPPGLPAEPVPAARVGGAQGGGAQIGGAQSSGAQSSGGLDAAAVRGMWQTVLLPEVRVRSKVTYALLSNATVHTIDGQTLVLTIASAPLVRQLSEERHVEKIVEALHAALGGDWKVRCELADAPGHRAEPGRPADHGQHGTPAGRPEPAAGRPEPGARTGRGSQADVHGSGDPGGSRTGPGGRTGSGDQPGHPTASAGYGAPGGPTGQSGHPNPVGASGPGEPSQPAGPAGAGGNGGGSADHGRDDHGSGNYSPAGNGWGGTSTAGTSTAGNSLAGASPGGTSTANSPGGNSSAGASPGGISAAGNSPAGNSPAGNSAVGNSAVGNSAVGNGGADNGGAGNGAEGGGSGTAGTRYGRRPASGARSRSARQAQPAAGRANGRATAVAPYPDDLPPEPDPMDDEEARMYAEAAQPSDQATSDRRDPEEIALALLADSLGARKIDER